MPQSIRVNVRGQSSEDEMVLLQTVKDLFSLSIARVSSVIVNMNTASATLTVVNATAE